MPARLEILTADGQPAELPLRLREVTADEGQAADGQPTSWVLANQGTTVLVEFALWVDGPGADHVMLAIDVGGKPGAWAEPGGSVVPDPDVLRPGEQARFWVCGLFGPDDVEDSYPFDLQITARSVRAA